MIYLKAKELENAHWGYDVERIGTKTQKLVIIGYWMSPGDIIIVPLALGSPPNPEEASVSLSLDKKKAMQIQILLSQALTEHKQHASPKGVAPKIPNLPREIWPLTLRFTS